MTTQNGSSLNLKVGKGRGWKDVFVVTFLVVVLGAFLAQISSTPKRGPGSEPMTSAVAAIATHA